MKKKIKVLAIILLSMIFLVGWGKKAVELLDDKKLIDLSKAIEYAKPGGETQKSELANEDSDKEETEETSQESSKTDIENIEEGEKIIVISIRDQVITYDGKSVDSVDQLEKLLRRDYKDNVFFSLVDDWAEAHQYKAIVKMMKALHSEIGLAFSIE